MLIFVLIYLYGYFNLKVIEPFLKVIPPNHVKALFYLDLTTQMLTSSWLAVVFPHSVMETNRDSSP